ncbi:MAG: hypothetical protein JWO82_2586 [Akkermansiaceae bacterium]|nr:hypothetical protein [Akkermansiaceae bacterium]
MSVGPINALMAIKLIANYSKRLGLPGYSSHQFSIEIESELSHLEDVSAEAERIYALLQGNVDEQIRSTGFVPPADYGTGIEIPHLVPAIPARGLNASGPWKCTAKQRELIENLVTEHHLDKKEVEALASDQFGKSVRTLNKTEASALIDQLIANHGRYPSHGAQPHFNRQPRVA